MESVPNLPCVYIARMEVEPTYLRRFMDWYEDKHAPDTISVGFHSAQAYHCRIGSPFIFNAYEIDSSEIFYTDAYSTMRTPEQDPQRPEVLAHIADRSNTVYAQVATIGVDVPSHPWTRGSRPGGIAADAISSLRFDVTEADDRAVVDWFNSHASTAVSALPGHRSSRLCLQSGRLHPANPSTQPRWLLLSEWDNEDVARDACARKQRLLSDPEVPGVATRTAYDCAVRTFSTYADG